MSNKRATMLAHVFPGESLGPRQLVGVTLELLATLLPAK